MRNSMQTARDVWWEIISYVCVIPLFLACLFETEEEDDPYN